ncbi:WcbI family polysaccharide biosynthesis putative acetyltransferase [Methylosinus sp. R-45379]|uniref:WcbI family polysaccharide biosynthesis putative acetyltransferase n=1 Tax=Methylosinus sp. R-45379 TaxID=980563 RepID=UPI000A452027|nr:WcbI family polysaccharide biosynthesis putative acetyltransferase [Methylosinus sp. R-45379]
MRRIAVIGVCQAWGIGDALTFLSEDADVIILEAPAIQNRGALHAASLLLEDRDLIITQGLPDEYGPLATEALRTRFPNLVQVPVFTFTGFHPDCIYLVLEGKAYSSPLGPYNSAIVAAAFSLGMPIDRVPGLFNAFIFRKAGYFDEFAKATEYARLVMSQFDFDIEPDWPDWLAHAPFMHTINHPKAFALASIAKLAAVKAGLIPKSKPIPTLPYDTLSTSAVWPVYPELGRPIGVQGSYIFKQPENYKEEMGHGVMMSLARFISGSYNFYGTYPREVFELDAVVRMRSVLTECIR